MPALRPLAAAPDESLHVDAGRLRRVRHLLVVGGADDDGTFALEDLVDVTELAVARFASARTVREAGPVGDVVPGTLALSRHSSLTGPWAPGAGVRAPATAYVLEVLVPRERGERPDAAAGDPDGLGRVFAAGLPVREEARVVAWLVDVARRVSGTLVLATDAGPVTLTPDPAARIDLAIFTDVWLDPGAALATLRGVDGRVVHAPDGEGWGGPPDALRSTAPEASVLDDDARAELHEGADAFDVATLTGDATRTGYALHLDLRDDGLVAVEIGGEEHPPPAVRRHAWAADGAVAYRVRWFPDDEEALHEEEPPPAHRVARGRAAEKVALLVRTLHGVVGGVVTDASDLPVHPADL